MSLRHTVYLHDFRGNRLDTAPSVEPVTASELRTHLRESESGLPDSEANDLIAEARQWIEDHLGVAFITQTWDLTLDTWPRGRGQWWDGQREGHISIIDGSPHDVDVVLPRWPLQSISSVKTYDGDSNETTVTVADVFDVDTQRLPGRIALQEGQTWPTALRPTNAIQIAYVAGYGDAATDVPAPLKRAVRQLAASLYSNRGDCSEMEDFLAKSGAASILRSYQIARL